MRSKFLASIKWLNPLFSLYHFMIQQFFSYSSFFVFVFRGSLTNEGIFSYSPMRVTCIYTYKILLVWKHTQFFCAWFFFENMSKHISKLTTLMAKVQNRQIKNELRRNRKQWIKSDDDHLIAISTQYLQPIHPCAIFHIFFVLFIQT